MKRKLKDGLKLLYCAPNPQQKELFFEKFELPSISYGMFLKQQVPFIRKGNWLLEIGIFLLALLGIGRMEAEILWLLSAFMPFLAMAAVTESNRSVQFKMDELEQASKFSLRAVVMSRAFIMGLSNLPLLIVCIFVSGDVNIKYLLYRGAVIIIPYLMSAFLNLLVVRKVHGEEAAYVCAGMSVLVSVGSMFNGIMDNPLYRYVGSMGIFLIFAAVSILSVTEYRKFIKQTEVYVWS